MPAPAALPSPLSAEQADLVARLTDGLEPAGLWWLSGYAAGLAQRTGLRLASPPAAEAVAGAVAAAVLTIVYGSQTGNSKRLAEQLARHAETRGLGVRLLRADAYPTRELKDERLLVVVISTQGDGDPPDDARGFVEHLSGKRAPALKALKFAVLGLGDSSYPQFNAIGRRLDARLAELGGERLLPRGDCDVDVETVATPWLAQALERAKDTLKSTTALATVTPLRPAAAPAPHGRDRPFAAEVLANQRLTGRGSSKDVRHLELSLEGSGLAYRPGDALGVQPVNAPALVDAVLAQLRLDGDTPIAHAGETLPLRTWLAAKRELTKLSRPFVQRHAERGGDPALVARLADADASRRLLESQQLLDLLRAHPGDWTGAELVAALRPLAPRLYSIASSQAAVGAEAHLTVAHVEWAAGDEPRHGVASHYLAGLGDGATVPVFVEANDRFRLPADPSRDVVMIGPGTGVAPFRGFVQERAAAGAHGRNWLLTGDRTRRHDFLYQLEWQQALRDGRLHRLDVAFSRDAPAGSRRRTYVQDRIREHGATLFAWLEGGAHVYVCGDAARMARDVDAALRDVVATHGGRDADAAGEYVAGLMQQGRYARDVY
jgi:sulfite reductase (NADPH) flavoprotein alpha-component